MIGTGNPWLYFASNTVLFKLLSRLPSASRVLAIGKLIHLDRPSDEQRDLYQIEDGNLLRMSPIYIIYLRGATRADGAHHLALKLPPVSAYFRPTVSFVDDGTPSNLRLSGKCCHLTNSNIYHCIPATSLMISFSWAVEMAVHCFTT